MNGRTTDWIRFLRQQRLDPAETKLVNDVEKYGCHIIQVREEGGFPGWSYTVGLSELLGCPELIVIGLNGELAGSVLNECARRLQKGDRFGERSRERELLSNVECEFRTVEKRWLRQTMGYAVWFYNGDNFSALQCVYPDLDNRFPWEQGFSENWRSRQPLLFPHPLSSAVEDDFWAANDPNSSLHRWQFSDAPHNGVFTTKRVMSGDDPITRVFHDLDDGSWQFHGPGESKTEDLAYVCFHHIVDKDPSITALSDLPLGWCAWRETPSSPWVREVDTSDDEEAVQDKLS
jgi:hypothetical protein